MADLVGDNTPVAGFMHPARRVAYLGPRLRDGMILGSVPILQEILKKNSRGGYRHQTSGMAAAYLRALRDPRTRKTLLRASRLSPESFAGDEDIARRMAVASMIRNLEKSFDDEFYKYLPRFYHECDITHALHTRDYDDESTRHADLALDRLETAISAVVHHAVIYAGRQLERDFGGLRAPKLVARLIN